jgi:LPS-assembly lipoprotein
MPRFYAPSNYYNGPRICVLLLLVSFCLSACGYKLAGTAELPPQLASIYLVTSDFSDAQRRSLQRSLSNAGALLVEQLDSQSVQLNVSLKTLPDRDLAVGASASTGARVKRISRSLSFNVKAADGEVLLAAQTLSQQKDASLDDDNLLSSDREKERVIRDLEQALFDQLIRQLTRI